MNSKKAIFLIFLIVLIDQLSKIYIKTHFALGESVAVFSWFKILFVENEGMAWGAKIPGEYGKLILSVFRIFAIFGIGYWLRESIVKKESNLLIFCISLIFSGALGNIIDSVVYGRIFGDSYGKIASVFPESGGYAPFFYGKVVDLFYFPLYNGILPDFIPFVGGTHFSFFDPVFNVADSAICIGVTLLLLFNKKVFSN